MKGKMEILPTAKHNPTAIYHLYLTCLGIFNTKMQSFFH